MEKVLNRGDIVLVSFPFTDLTATKVRPAVVISNDSINRFSEDIILAFVSSVVPVQINETDFLIRSSELDFQATGLKNDALFKMAKIVTLNKRLIQKRIGKVSRQIRKELDERLKKALAL